MAKAAPKKKSSAKKAARTSAAAKAPVKKKAAPAKAAAKKAAPKKAAPKKAPASKAAAKAVAKRPAGRPPAKKKAAAQAPAKRTAARPAAKKAAIAKSAARRPVGRPTARKAVAPAKRARSSAKPAAAKKPAPQTFTVSHLNEADFKADGLRAYAQYRDLGIAAATGGLCQAHVIRLIPPCTDEVRKRHIHDTELQLIYVLKGWIKNEFEGHGEQMMSAGTCWLQPPGIKHTVLDYSADCEVLEIIVPADFKTTEVA